MEIIDSPSFEYTWFDSNGRDISMRSADEAVRAIERQGIYNDYLTQNAEKRLELLSRHEVNKPSWFQTAERNSKTFLGSIGLHAAENMQVTLLDVNDNISVINDIFGRDTDGYIVTGLHEPYFGVLIRYDSVVHDYESNGPISTGRLLVHELTHSNEPKSNYRSYRKAQTTNEWSEYIRQGFSISIDGVVRGDVFTEGLAEYNAGLYARRVVDGTCCLVENTRPYSRELPLHYIAESSEKAVSPECLDAYAIELMASGLEDIGEVSADEFIHCMWGVYSTVPDISLSSLRSFIGNINRLKSNLYKELATAQPGGEGLSIVYEAVS